MSLAETRIGQIGREWTTPSGIFCRTMGQGAPVLMIRGLARSSSYWLGFDTLLARHCQVITMDNRGVGRSSATCPRGLTIADLARDAVEVLDYLKIPAAHVFGMSLGGMVALEMSLSFKTRVSSATLINSSVGGLREQRLTRRGLQALLRAAVAKREHVEETLAEVLLSPALPREMRQALARKWKALSEWEPVPLGTIIRQLRAASKFSPISQLSEVALPVLIMSGGLDQFVPPRNSVCLHSLIKGSRYAVHPTGGHELPCDAPDWVAETFFAFCGIAGPAAPNKN